LSCLAVAVVIIAAVVLIPSDRLFGVQTGPGAFYRIVPYLGMVIPAVTLFIYGILIWLQGVLRFWNEPDSPLLRKPDGLKPLFRAIGDAATLKYLGGGGPGCFYPEEAPSNLRRAFHTSLVLGFLLDLASTTVAFVYEDFLHWLPPYPYLSAPVVLGTVGGVLLVIGAIGLLALKVASDRALGNPIAYSLDYAFILTLGLTGLTGLLVLLLRTTSALGIVLVCHLAMVAALFFTAPYGKFVHFVYRSFALLRFEIEQGAGNQVAGH
jgi:citrate/tricarballylate utilization protein